jgi:hypothetical protein
VSRHSRGQGAKLALLAALLLVLVAVLIFQNAPRHETTLTEVEASLNEAAEKKGPDGRSLKAEPDDANSRYAFKIIPGTAHIERDLQAISFSGTGPTALDGMDRSQLTAFRLEKIEKYRQLGFFRPGYSPFTAPHNRIYGPITPGASWLYSVPYYIANPYLLLVLVPANHVTPIDLSIPEVDIRYQNGTLRETIRGDSARAWFQAVYSSDRPGLIRIVMVNAWDAGFRYIHLDPLRSRNIKPGDRLDHVTRTWHSQSSIFHVGRYKKNNLSPEDHRAWVELLKRDKPTRLFVKLWHAQPADVGDKADLIFVFRIYSQKA